MTKTQESNEILMHSLDPQQTRGSTLAAKTEISNPVTAHLAVLIWDGVPRLDRWLVDYAGAEDSSYVRIVSRKMLVAAVRRARVPGSTFDQLPVIVGTQGSGKTSALRVLAGEDDWFTDDLPLGSDTRRFIEATAGKWIVEAAELHGMCREDAASFKGLLSKTWDEARMPYARKRERFAREFVIIGTSHETEGYLIDTPENRRCWSAPKNRRFWPVGIQRFDLARLRADRDQLWAEAPRGVDLIGGHGNGKTVTAVVWLFGGGVLIMLLIIESLCWMLRPESRRLCTIRKIVRHR